MTRLKIIFCHDEFFLDDEIAFCKYQIETMVAKSKSGQDNKGKPTLANRENSDTLSRKAKTLSVNDAPKVSVGASYDLECLKKLAPNGLTPMQHQLEAVAFTLKNLDRGRASYLALAPGLGKTIVAALISNYYEHHTVVYVCPPFLTANTQAEFDKWGAGQRLALFPDSMITKDQTLARFMRIMELSQNAILIVDEAHRFKNESAQRTRALLKNMLPHFKGHVVFMSGTPMPNSRPKEIWGILKAAAPSIFGTNFFTFGLKYCGGYKDSFGWNFDGFTNRAEFRARITKSFMLRMKKDVLKLPPLVEGLLTVGEGIPPVISKLEKKILAHYSAEDLIEGEIKKLEGKADLHLATYLRLLGEYKLKYVLPVIESLLEETKESFLLFAVHKETIAKLTKALEVYKPLVITGDVPKEKRQPLVNEFQANPERRVFIGNIEACGVGFTLTKATRVLFIEFSWVDGANSQAADRAHRYGQTESVLAQYVVLKDSFDRQRMETLLRKRALAI